MSFVDSHAHLEASTSLKELRGASVDDLEGALKRAADDDVREIITIGTSIETSKKAIEIAQKYSSADLKIYAACGLHPKDAKEEIGKLGVNESIHRLKSIAKSSSKVVGIGECGLDYYKQETGNNKHKTTDEEKEFQRELFRAQIKLAADLDLPLVIHCRNGWDEIFDLLSSNGQGLIAKGVFHSWTGDWEAAKRALELGFYISFSGIVTFKNATAIQRVAREMPLDRMLVETDSPYLSPEPFRGMQNEPKNVRITAQFISNLRKEPLDTIEETTTQNARDLFGIKN